MAHGNFRRHSRQVEFLERRVVPDKESYDVSAQAKELSKREEIEICASNPMPGHRNHSRPNPVRRRPDEDRILVGHLKARFLE